MEPRTPESQARRPAEPGRMETLREALARLEGRGFAGAFRARPDGRLALGGGRAVVPESLVVEEVVRFEGESDPEDQAVLFALRSRDGRLRGTLVASYGVGVDPDVAEAVRRLDRRPRGGSRPSAAAARDSGDARGRDG